MIRVLDNIDIYILTKLNALAERYGIPPYEFIATLQVSKDGPETHLCFEAPVDGNPDMEARFATMTGSLGVDIGGTLSGDERTICKALEKALALAPQPRCRG